MARFDSHKWSVGARSETGYVRDENQDRMTWVRAPFGDVFVVSDGMGGHSGGALAAELTVQTLQQHLSAVNLTSSLATVVKGAFEAANQVVHERGHSGDAQTAGMGATAVALLVTGSRVMAAHVGDSRAYLFSRTGELRRLTKDHSRVQRMVDAGMLTPAEAERHPDASILERAIGRSPSVEVEISSWLRLRDEDQLLLCSDGLCGYVGDPEIAAVLGNHQNPQQGADQLVNLALEKGGEDNITVQLIRYEGDGKIMSWRQLFGPAAIVLTAVGASVAAAFVAHEYRQSSLLAKVDALEEKTAEINKQLRAGEANTAQAVKSLNSQIAELTEKMNKPPGGELGSKARISPSDGNKPPPGTTKVEPQRTSKSNPPKKTVTQIQKKNGKPSTVVGRPATTGSPQASTPVHNEDIAEPVQDSPSTAAPEGLDKSVGQDDAKAPFSEETNR